LMPRYDFLTKPALHRRIAFQKGAHDFANGGTWDETGSGA
jgi:hypothetical protein